jgi:hypothetical protein
LQARQSLVGVVAAGAQQRITLMLTVGGGFAPPSQSPAEKTAELRKSIP